MEGPHQRRSSRAGERDRPPSGPVASRWIRQEESARTDVDDAGGTAIKIHATLAELSVVIAAPLTPFGPPEESPIPLRMGIAPGELFG